MSDPVRAEHGQPSVITADPSVPEPATVTGSTTGAPDDDTDIPAGLLVSVGERGGYAVPRQLDGHIRR